ncbi:MAG: gamma-glutamylcyclotransferase [bacterium]|nr:gamma-glutamylcyclotransferase [bacterium]
MSTTRKTTKSFDRHLQYFAYGANLSQAEMRRRCPESRPLGPALLENHRLCIALPADAPPGPGWATIAPSPGDSVHGALYALHTADLPALDDYEGYPALYRRTESVILTDKAPMRAMLYQMRTPLRGARPTRRYTDTLRSGYQDFGLPLHGLEILFRENESF